MNFKSVPQNHEYTNLVRPNLKFQIKKITHLKSPRIGNISAKLIKAGGTTLVKELYKLISITLKNKLSNKWKTSVIFRVYRKCDTFDWNNYYGIALLLICKQSVKQYYANAPNRSLNVVEIIRDYHCGLRRKIYIFWTRFSPWNKH